jgi:hypothetical protein
MKQLTQLDIRWYRGFDIAATRRIARGGLQGDRYRYAYVQSQNDASKWYIVTEDGKCDCPDFYYRGFPCKHIWAVIIRGMA